MYSTDTFDLDHGQLEFIVRRAVANVKARTGCQCRVSSEVLLSPAGEAEPHVWAIVPCRLHMADSTPPAASSLARDIEAEALLQMTRYAKHHRQSA
jgi:hypothetical protein